MQRGIAGSLIAVSLAADGMRGSARLAEWRSAHSGVRGRLRVRLCSLPACWRLHWGRLRLGLRPLVPERRVAARASGVEPSRCAALLAASAAEDPEQRGLSPTCVAVGAAAAGKSGRLPTARAAMGPAAEATASPTAVAVDAAGVEATASRPMRGAEYSRKPQGRFVPSRCGLVFSIQWADIPVGACPAPPAGPRGQAVP
jgi:hypothetical protein